jgi:hypothetical protein
LMFLLGIAEGRSIPSVASQRFGVANKWNRNSVSKCFLWNK